MRFFGTSEIMARGETVAHTVATRPTYFGHALNSKYSGKKFKVRGFHENITIVTPTGPVTESYQSKCCYCN